jgi:hypothetical protein
LGPLDASRPLGSGLVFDLLAAYSGNMGIRFIFSNQPNSQASDNPLDLLGTRPATMPAYPAYDPSPFSRADGQPSPQAAGPAPRNTNGVPFVITKK